MGGVQVPDLPFEIGTESSHRPRVAWKHSSAAARLKLPSSQDRNLPAAGLVGKSSYVAVTASSPVLVDDRRAFQDRQESADRPRLDAVHQVVTQHAGRIGEAVGVLASL